MVTVVKKSNLRFRSIILHGNTAGTVDAVRSAILDGQTIGINSGVIIVNTR